jgi:hypothetical protein
LEEPVDGSVVGRLAAEFVDEDDVDVCEVVELPLFEADELPEPVDPDVEPDPSWPQPAVPVREQVAPPPVSGAAEGVGSAANAGAEKRTGPAMTHMPTRPAAMRCFMPPPIFSP